MSGLPRTFDDSPFRAILENYTNIITSVTFEEAEETARMYARGNMLIPGRMKDKMFRESTFSAAVNKRINALLSRNMRVVPFSSRPRDKKFAKFVSERLSEMFPRTQLKELMKQLLTMNIMVGTLEWENMLPSVRAMHPQWLWNNPANYVWYYQTRNEGRPEVEFGDDKNLKDVGKADPYTYFYNKPYIQIKDKDPSWLLWSDWRPGSTDAPVCNLSTLWCYKQLVLQKLAEACKSYSSPIEKVIVPQSADGKKGRAFYNQYLELRDSKVIMVQRGPAAAGAEMENSYDVETIPMGNAVNDKMYLDTIDKIDDYYNIYFLGGNLSSNVNKGTGSRAAVQGHIDELREVITPGDASILSEFLREQVLMPLAAVWDPSEKTMAPYIEFDLYTLQGPTETINAMLQFATLASQLGQPGRIRNLAEVAAQWGIDWSETNGEQQKTAPQTKIATHTADNGTGEQDDDQADLD